MDTKGIDLEVTVTLATPFHVGGGKGSVGSFNYIARDAQNRPYWPGSAAKGKTRQTAMQLYEAKTGMKCNFAHVNTDEGVPCDCLICDMMGNAGNRKGKLLFSDFSLQENGDPLHNAHTEIRVGNAIDRYRQVAEDDHLFGTEIASATGNLILKGRIKGDLSTEHYGEQLELLKTSLSHIACIGGNTSRGLGWVESVAVKDVNEETKGSLTAESYGRTGICFDSQINNVGQCAIELNLIPKSPLLIGKHSSESNYRDTQYVIPGSLIRAYLAKEITCRAQQDNSAKINYVTEPAEDEMDSPFALLRKEFTNIRMTAMMPLGARVFPVTARCCKYGDHGCKHDYWDVLALLLSETGESQACPACGGREERKDGLYVEDNKRATAVRPRTMVVTKSSVDRHRNTSRDEMLYSMRHMTPFAETDIDENAPLYFSGAILLDDYKGPEKQQLLKELCEILGHEAQIGAYQTAGYGKMQVRGAVKEYTRDTPGDIKQRILKFNEIIAQIRQDGQSGEDSSQVGTPIFVPVTLQSDAFVILDDIPEGEEDKMYLNSYSKLFPDALKDVKLIRVLAQHGYWRGFDTSRKDHYLKESQRLIYAGAVFVIELDDLSDGILERLLDLQEKGICSDEKPALNAQNGYGKVTIVDTFHIDYAKWNKEENRK